MTDLLFDTHCHLDFEVFDADREQVLQRAYSKGIRHVWVPGTSINTPRLQLEQCAGVQLHYAVGLHPYFIAEHQPKHLTWVEQQLAANSNLWVGEIGLDRTCEHWQKQCEFFVEQVQLAVRYQRPLILHHRKSQSDLLGYLNQYLERRPVQGIVHAFSGSYEQACSWVDKGFKLGVGGTITYERARKTRDAISRVPLTALVLETDAPDMPLAGRQGQRNEPAYCAEVLRALQELRAEPAATVAKQLWQTSCQLAQLTVGDDNATC